MTTVAGIVGAAVSGDFGRAGAAVSRATGALSNLVRRPWNAFKAAVRPVLDWITRRIPDMFTRVRDATSGTLGGIGDFVSTGLQALAGVVTGPIKGLIAFANWVIDGLNSLGGEFLGKKFGVDLDKIPQLAEGGVVAPRTTVPRPYAPVLARPAAAGRGRAPRRRPRPRTAADCTPTANRRAAAPSRSPRTCCSCTGPRPEPGTTATHRPRNPAGAHRRGPPLPHRTATRGRGLTKVR